MNSVKYFRAFWVIALSFLLSTAFAQPSGRDVNLGDKLFKVEDYFHAKEYYLKAMEENPEDLYLLYQVAECHRLIYAYDEAQEGYHKVMTLDQGQKYPLARYYYAQMLKDNGQFDQAEKQYEDFLTSYSQTAGEVNFMEMASLEREGCLLALEELKRPRQDFKFQNLGEPINSTNSDFSTALYLNDTSIVIASDRILEKNQEIYGRYGGAFLDNYRFDKNDSMWVDLSHESQSKFERVNSKFNDGTGVFTPDQSKYYFTRCDDANKEAVECAIYVTSQKDGKWQSAEKLNKNINLPGYWNAQPSLSATGDTLYFSSKRPGGQGMHDIWYAVLENSDEEDNWGEAVNMGKEINTPYADVYPYYYAPEKLLFFSSNGREGFGGLDIFLARGENLDTIRNLGLPFNSHREDFGFVLGDTVGYMSSNRVGGLGGDDIYTFNIESMEALITEIERDTLGEIDLITIRGKIYDKDNNPAVGVGVLLTDTTGKVLKRTLTNDQGEFVFADLPADKDYRVLLEQPDNSLFTDEQYKLDSLQIEGSKNENFIVSDDQSGPISISGVIVDDDGNPVADVGVGLFDQEGNQLKRTNTDEDGAFVFSDLDPSKAYKVEVLDDGNYHVEGVRVDVAKGQVNTTSLAVAEQGLISSKVLFENIYFDYDKSFLRPEAKKVLDELVAYAKKNPKLKLEINGHTDSQGTNDYNLNLGLKRGNTAYNYLIAKGLSRSNIVVNTIGESNPIASNSDASGRSLNRRVEFYVVGGGAYQSKARAYVVPPRTSLRDVARRFNMSEQELKELNDIKDDEVKSYRPLRVKNAEESEGEAEEQDSTTKKTFTVTAKGYNKGVLYAEYDGSGYYQVMPKNTLSSIAKVCGTQVEDIKRWNQLNKNRIFVGQVLRVAENVKMTPDEFVRTHRVEMGDYSMDQHGNAQVVDYQDYKVREGDTFYSVAKRYQMTFEQLRKANQLEHYSLTPGTTIKVRK